MDSRVRYDSLLKEHEVDMILDAGMNADKEVEPMATEYVEIRGKKGYVNLYIGMPKDSVKMLVGRPASVDLNTRYDGTTVENWGYKINNSYIDDLHISFENGRLKGVDQNDY